MKLSGVAFTSLMLCNALGGCLGAVPLPPAQQGGPSASARNEGAVLKYLRPALKSSGKAPRVYYRASCQGKGGNPVPFPRTEVQPPSKGKTGVAAVREVFRDDKDVTVTEGRTGIIRIRIGKAPDAFLQTKISLLTLKPMEQYNPTLAVSAIESTGEVEAAMRRLGVRPVQAIGTQLIAEPAKGLPHLPSSMKNVTVDQALDSIAKTFKDVVVYGACVRLFWVDLR